jgi:hypothetical protein
MTAPMHHTSVLIATEEAAKPTFCLEEMAYHGAVWGDSHWKTREELEAVLKGGGLRIRRKP